MRLKLEKWILCFDLFWIMNYIYVHSFCQDRYYIFILTNRTIVTWSNNQGLCNQMAAMNWVYWYFLHQRAPKVRPEGEEEQHPRGLLRHNQHGAAPWNPQDQTLDRVRGGGEAYFCYYNFFCNNFGSKKKWAAIFLHFLFLSAMTVCVTSTFAIFY